MCWLLLVDCVLCVGVVTWSWVVSYDSQMRQSAVASRHLAEAALSHAETTLDKASWTLDGIVERVAGGTLEQRSLQRFLSSRVKMKASPLQGLFVVDAAGRQIVASTDEASPGAGMAREPWFVHHRSHPGAAIHVGRPALHRASGQWIITVSRRIDDIHGGFAGAVVATIPVRYFEDFYERLSLGGQGSMLLTTADGTVVARAPKTVIGVGDNVNASAPHLHMSTGDKESGTVMLSTPADGTERLHAFRRSATYPLIADAALGKDDILAAWWRVTLQEGAVLAGVIGGAYLVALWLIGQMRVREFLERQLRNTQAALEERNAALERMAHTDGLTGLYNRRYLDERMAAEVARAAREKTALSLILIDVDFFKRYNDTYGHAAGDDCLRAVARVMAASVHRPADVAGRFGGEEFGILLPNTAGEGARQLAEAICRGVHATGLEHRGSDFGSLTISAGVATVVPAPDDQARSLIEAADAALYRAKAAGRNTVQV